MDPYIGEVRVMAFDYAPVDWARCDGQQLNLQQYQALFAVINNRYGGSPPYFLLPDLRGRAVMGWGNGPEGGQYVLAQTGGSATATLSLNNMPPHNHVLQSVKGPGTVAGPSGTNYPAALTVSSTQGWFAYRDGATATSPVFMNGSSVQPVGHGTAHDNLQPYLNMEFCISLSGVYPSPP